MPDPPKPLVPPALLMFLARLAWVACPNTYDGPGAVLGLFGLPGEAPTTGLYVDSNDPTWNAYAATCSGLGPFYVTRATADVLQQGTLATDGSITYAGRSYRVQATIENGHGVARAVVVS